MEDRGRKGEEGWRERGMRERRKGGKNTKSSDSLSSLQVSFHGFPITNSSSFPDVDLCSLQHNSPPFLLRGALFPILATPGLPSPLLSSPTRPPPALHKSPRTDDQRAFQPWALVFSRPLPHSRSALPSPLQSAYLPPLFINMSTLLLNIKGFLRNSSPYICLGVIWMFRMEIQRPKIDFVDLWDSLFSPHQYGQARCLQEMKHLLPHASSFRTLAPDVNHS